MHFEKRRHFHAFLSAIHYFKHKSGPIQALILFIFVLSLLYEEAIQNTAEWCHSWDCMLLCREPLSLKPTAQHSASPPVYKHYGTLHWGSSLPINLYLSACVEPLAFLRCNSSSSISTAGLSLSMAPFFSSTPEQLLNAFIFIACICAQLSYLI